VIVTTPGRSVDKTGAWPAKIPISPSVPGMVTLVTSPENKSRAGETSSK
jgi:hypothetical protein